ncbi:DUF6179 domain-containing protein [Brevibacillus borstelensis]|uniref:DUF6179 domain-containing protein n=1 Tax=Brevibacillus borstelensis TaxID=45462 RepID=UPI0030BBE3E6
MDTDNARNAASDNQSLVSESGINPSFLNKSRYTLSLLSEGHRAGIFNNQEIYSIQNQILVILQDLIKRYTQGESSSVTTETAEGIMTSVLYALDAYLLNVEHHDKAIAYLKTVDMAKLYEKGLERVSQTFEEAKLLYQEIKQHKLDVPVDAYNLTIEESLPVFMKKYGIIFDAHNTMASIDYPLAIDDMRLQGVFYMKQYMERLKLENEFCFKFKNEDLLNLLKNFGRMCRFDYRIELFNIFMLVLNHSLFSILSGGDTDQVRISAYQFERLERMFTHSDASGIGTMIRKAMHLLKGDLQIDDKTANYMNQCSKELVWRIINAAEHNNLHSVIITDVEEKIKPVVISLNTGDKMSDVRLRTLLEEIIRGQTKEEKARLIKSNFFSLHDYLDMLESECLYGDEYEALYASFGDMELAILAKIVFYQELRGGDMNLHTIVSEKGDAEPAWQMRLIGFMKGLSALRIREIEKLIDNIDYEEIKFY